MSACNRERRSALVGVLGILLSLGLALPVAAEQPAAAAAPAAQKADKADKAEKAKSIVLKGKDADALLKRARDYWEARVARSPSVYDYYPKPGMDGYHPPSEFGTLSFTDYEIRGIYTDGKRGVVVVKADTYIHVMQGIRLPERYKSSVSPELAEEWNLIDGNWYKKPVKGGLSRFMRRDKKDKEKAQPEAEEKAEDEAGETTPEEAKPVAETAGLKGEGETAKP